MSEELNHENYIEQCPRWVSARAFFESLTVEQKELYDQWEKDCEAGMTKPQEIDTILLAKLRKLQPTLTDWLELTMYRHLHRSETVDDADEHTETTAWGLSHSLSRLIDCLERLE